MNQHSNHNHPTLQSIAQWGPIILVLIFSGITYGVQRTSLALIPSGTTYTIFTGTNLTLKDILVFIQIAAILVSFGFFKVLGGFFSSKICLKYTRKIALRIATILLLIGSIGMIFTQYLWLMIIANGFIGGGLGMILSICMVALPEIAGNKSGAFSVGIMGFSMYFGSSIGSFIAGLIANQLGFGPTFIFALVMAGIAITIETFLIKNIETKSNVKGKREEVLLDSSKVEHEWTVSNIFKTPTLPLTYLGVHFSRIKDSLLVLLFPVLLFIVYDFNALQIGTATSVFSMVWSLSMPLTGKFSDTIGRKKPIFVGLFLDGLGILFMSLTSSFGLIIFSSFLAGLGTAFYYPSFHSITKDVVPIVKQGQAISIYRVALDSGYIMGPFIIVLLIILGGRWNALGTIFSTGGILKLPFLVIGISLIIIGFLYLSMATETKPGWVQTEFTLKHASTIESIFHDINEAITAYINEDTEHFNTKIKTAKEKENKADQLVKQILDAMYNRVRPAPDDYQFYRLAEALDSSVTYLFKAVRKLELIQPSNLTEVYKDYLKEELGMLVEIVHRTNEALEVTIIQPMMNHPIYYAISKLEKSLDIHKQETLKKFVPVKHDNPVQSLLLIQIISRLEEVANNLEYASKVMRILGMKHSVA